MTILSLLLDVVMIGLLGAGIFYAIRLTRQLADMRSSRADMERFILDFTATVARAEAGVKGLKNASRSCGDELEPLIERGQNLREELGFLIESADQMANRLTATGTFAARASTVNEPLADVAKKTSALKAEKPVSSTQASTDKTAATASAAERDLLRALSKLG